MLTRAASSMAGNRPLYWNVMPLFLPSPSRPASSPLSVSGRGVGGEGFFVRLQSDPRLACPVQDQALVPRIKLLERHVQREAGVASERFGEAGEGAILTQFGPGGQRPLAQGCPRV